MIDSYCVIYSPEALNDLRDIYSYISFDLNAESAAKGQIDRIRKEIRSLDTMPARYSLVDWEPWKSLKMHKVTVDNFVVFYTIDPDAMIVTIIRIMYGGRDIEAIAREGNAEDA